MSTESVTASLDAIDEAREELVLKLPWYKRPFRRYLTGDAFWAYNVSSLMTWPQAFTVGFSFKALWAGWILKYPAATAFLAKVWGAITSAMVGAYNVVVHGH